MQPIYTHVVWSLIVPPKIQNFLWLLSHNKIMTRENLGKRHVVKPLDCVFYNKDESIQHLMFECAVARVVSLVFS